GPRQEGMGQAPDPAREAGPARGAARHAPPRARLSPSLSKAPTRPAVRWRRRAVRPIRLSSRQVWTEDSAVQIAPLQATHRLPAGLDDVLGGDAEPLPHVQRPLRILERRLPQPPRRPRALITLLGE